MLPGKLEGIDTKEENAHISYKDIENLDFQIMRTNNCYTNQSSIQIFFPMKTKKLSKEATDIDNDLIIVR